jgi:hypothetical protein
MRHFPLFPLVLAAILGALCLSAHAQESFCALDVLVLSEDLNPIYRAAVDLIDLSGKVVQTQITNNGRVKFCDFGFGSHSISVRQTNPPREYCQSSVSNLKYIYNLPQKITVVLNSCLGHGADGGRGVGGGGEITTCAAFIRITTPAGTKIPNVQIINNQRPSVPVFTDKDGKAFVPIDRRSTAELAVSKTGYRAQKRQIQCSGMYETEEVGITLTETE